MNETEDSENHVKLLWCGINMNTSGELKKSKWFVEEEMSQNMGRVNEI